jgi:hypothetical protein
MVGPVYFIFYSKHIVGFIQPLDLIFLILGSGRYIKTDLPLGSIIDGIMILTF